MRPGSRGQLELPETLVLPDQPDLGVMLGHQEATVNRVRLAARDLPEVLEPLGLLVAQVSQEPVERLERLALSDSPDLKVKWEQPVAREELVLRVSQGPPVQPEPVERQEATDGPEAKDGLGRPDRPVLPGLQDQPVALGLRGQVGPRVFRVSPEIEVQQVSEQTVDRLRKLYYTCWNCGL